MIPQWIISWVAPIIARYIVTAASGYMIKRGWTAHVDWAQVSVGVTGFIVSLGWAVHSNKTPDKVLDRLASHAPAVEGPEGHSQPQI